MNQMTLIRIASNAKIAKDRRYCNQLPALIRDKALLISVICVHQW